MFDGIKLKMLQKENASLKDLIMSLKEENESLVTQKEDLERRIKLYEGRMHLADDMISHYQDAMKNIEEMKKEYNRAIEETQLMRSEYRGKLDDLLNSIRIEE